MEPTLRLTAVLVGYQHWKGWTWTEPRHSLTVWAFDLGDPASQSSSTTITIAVRDSNDNIPQFLQLRYYGSVRESDAPGEVVAVLTHGTTTAHLETDKSPIILQVRNLKQSMYTAWPSTLQKNHFRNGLFLSNFPVKILKNLWNNLHFLISNTTWDISDTTDTNSNPVIIFSPAYHSKP